MTAPKQAILLIYGDDGTALGYDLDTPEVTIEDRREECPDCYLWPPTCRCVPVSTRTTFTLTASRYRMIRGTNPDQRPELEAEEATR